jgi:quercetin dioxygenase-like cupin family protein
MTQPTTLPGDFVAQLGDTPSFTEDWGHLTWLVSAAAMQGAEQTLGVVTIHPGKRNPLHSHPNCEELLYVVSGECEHRLGADTCRLVPGSVIRIPRGVQHWARCTSDIPLVAVISFSSGDRRTESHEGGGKA